MDVERENLAPHDSAVRAAGPSRPKRKNPMWRPALRSAALAATLAASPSVFAADIVTVDTSGGQDASIRIGADGLPLIAYRDQGNNELMVAKCTTANCSARTLQSVADANGTPARGEAISLAVRSNGVPVMTWYDGLTDDLSFARCPNADCSGDDILRALDDSANDTGRESAMAVDAADLVHVAYVNTTDGALQYIHCQQLTCMNPTAHVIDDDPVNFLGSSIDMVLNFLGDPVIAYTDNGADDLLVAYCSGGTCAGGADTINVLTSTLAAVTGQLPAIAINSQNHPIVAWYDGGSAALRVANCTDTRCNVGQVQALIDDDNSVEAGFYPSIAIRPNGHPIIAYQYRVVGGAGGSGLRVAECSDHLCTGPVRSITLDYRPGEITGAGTDITIGADGGAVIAYYDTETTSLKVAKCNPQTCIGPGDRLFADGFD